MNDCWDDREPKMPEELLKMTPEEREQEFERIFGPDPEKDEYLHEKASD